MNTEKWPTENIVILFEKHTYPLLQKPATTKTKYGIKDNFSLKIWFLHGCVSFNLNNSHNKIGSLSIVF